VVLRRMYTGMTPPSSDMVVARSRLGKSTVLQRRKRLHEAAGRAVLHNGHSRLDKKRPPRKLHFTELSFSHQTENPPQTHTIERQPNTAAGKGKGGFTAPTLSHSAHTPPQAACSAPKGTGRIHEDWLQSTVPLKYAGVWACGREDSVSTVAYVSTCTLVVSLATMPRSTWHPHPPYRALIRSNGWVWLALLSPAGCATCAGRATIASLRVETMLLDRTTVNHSPASHKNTRSAGRPRGPRALRPFQRTMYDVSNTAENWYVHSPACVNEFSPSALPAILAGAAGSHARESQACYDLTRRETDSREVRGKGGGGTERFSIEL
jgi:hypothetical protein